METSAQNARRQTPDELIAQINLLMEEAEALLVGPATEKIGDTVSEMQCRCEAMQARLGEIYRHTRNQIVNRAKSVDRTLRSHPYESFAIALGVGVLIGALVCRDRT